MQGRGCTLIVNLVFAFGFLLATGFYLWRQSYIQAAGFLLLSIANLPELYRMLREPPPITADPSDVDPDEVQTNRISTMIAIVALALLGIGWVTSAPVPPTAP
ncbi:MAG: hypothetical protein HC911_05740 [Chloroflexaceae bacterium]|nr:hypothetical protein [Chloroflexaceae bacterium]